MRIKSWISSKTIKGKKSDIHGLGFFAISEIKKGEIIAKKGGHLINSETLKRNQKIIKNSQLQIDDNLYLAPETDEEFEDSMIYINHSCEPNVGVISKNLCVALRDIKTGEELTCDYGTVSADDLYLKCNCGTDSCRKIITGNDYKNKAIQDKYKEFFPDFILKKIKKLSN
jgi:uncharacterized protein